jgi:transcriptional regulator with XRE-family HTH domain
MTFGASLKDWRRRRGMSQLRLAMEADVSARHVAFLETGRANPTRGMIIRLAEALEVPRPQRNALLQAADFTPAYAARRLDDRDMSAIRHAVDWLLERHEPMPGLALDRHWRLVAMNGPARRLLENLGLGVGDNLLDALVEGASLRSAIVNWEEVAWHLAVRLRTGSRHAGGDPRLDAAAHALAEAAGQRAVTVGTLPPMVPTRLAAGGVELSFFSTIAQFGTAEDITVADLRVELLFPADEATRSFLHGTA